MNILISGGTSGLGLELAKQFATQGHKVYIFSRRATNGHQTHENILTLQADVSDKASLKHLKGQLESGGIKVDWLINNAGKTEIGSPYQTPYLGRHWQEIISTNVMGPLNLIEIFLDDLIDSKQSIIINMSSVLAFFPTGFFSVYAGSKAFLSCLSHSLATIKDNHGIRVINVILPMLDTEMSKDINLNRVNKMSAKLAAENIIRDLAKNNSTIKVGEAKLLMMLKRFIPNIIQKNFNKLSNDYISKTR